MGKIFGLKKQNKLEAICFLCGRNAIVCQVTMFFSRTVHGEFIRSALRAYLEAL